MLLDHAERTQQLDMPSRRCFTVHAHTPLQHNMEHTGAAPWKQHCHDVAGLAQANNHTGYEIHSSHQVCLSS